MNLIGLDLGIHKVNAAVFLEGDAGLTLYDVPSYEPNEHTRPAELYSLSRWVLDLADFHDADSLWIEDVLIGNNRKYSIELAQNLGAILAVLALIENKTRITLVNTQQWKKEVVGSGHASKDDVKNYIHETHPVYAALCEDDQDAYDATCVGLYGLTILDRASSLSL